MGAKYTETQAQASIRYMEQLDRITIRVEKGKKDEYRKKAESAGKSLNRFIIDCIEERIFL